MWRTTLLVDSAHAMSSTAGTRGGGDAGGGGGGDGGGDGGERLSPGWVCV
jgi:hypothetical protein